MLRFALLALWVAVIAGTGYVLLFHREAAQRQFQDTASGTAVAAAAIYLVLASLRGFTLIPATSLMLLAVPFFPPTVLFVLTLLGAAVSSTSIYYFSAALRLDEMFEERQRVRIDRLKALLQRHQLPIIIGWSFFPLTPTDVICYVCGALRVSFPKFLLGVLIGKGTICAMYIYGGDAALRLLQWKG